MPSKTQYEINKLRGEVSKDDKISNDNIKLLRDNLSQTELAIKALESERTDYNSKINQALAIAHKGIILAKGAIRRSGDTCPAGSEHKFSRLRAVDTTGLIIKDLNNVVVARFGRYGTKKLNISSIDEMGAGTGVTIDSTLLKDGALDEGDLHACKVLTDVKGTPEEGDLKMDTVNHKLQVYNGTAWETVTSA